MLNFKKIFAILTAALMLSATLYGCKPAVTSTTSSSTESSEAVSQDSSEDSSITSSDEISEELSEAISGESSQSAVESGSQTGASSTVKSTTTSKTSSLITSRPIKVVPPSNSTSGIVKNMNGRTVVWQMPASPAASAADKHVERLKAKIAAVEKKYNCHIKIVNSFNESGGLPPKSLETKLSVLAGQPIVDIWWQNGFLYEFLPHYTAGLLQPLDALKCFNWTEPQYKSPYNDAMTVNKVHYGVNVGGAGMGGAFQFEAVMFYRQDVLVKSGVAANMMPDVLTANGTWTYDNFKKVCQTVVAAGNVALTDRPNATSNGVQINFYTAMCYTFGTDYIKQDPVTKAITFNGGSTAALAALNLYTSLVQGKVISAPTNDGPAEIHQVDNLAFQCGLLFAAKWDFPRLGGALGQANWNMTYLPKVKASDEYTLIADETVGGYAIPYGVKNPNDAATVLQACIPLETDTVAARAETMMDYKQWVNANNGDHIIKIETEINNLAYTSKQKGQATQLASGCGVANDWLKHVQKIANGQEDANSVIAANSAKYNSLLKNLYTLR